MILAVLFINLSHKVYLLYSSNIQKKTRQLAGRMYYLFFLHHLRAFTKASNQGVTSSCLSAG